MKSDSSTTEKSERSEDAATMTAQWELIDWVKVEAEVNRLQTRIAKAAVKGDKNKVRRLQYLLTHTFYAKALAVRKVTTNKGKYTSGVDRKLWSSSASKMRAVYSLSDKQYRSKPLRRVYIAKKGQKNKKRPLGIPTMYDRAMQTLYAFALAPVAESTGDRVSFGFRQGRSAKDAGEHLFTVLARKVSPEWVLEGDIKGCFDNIDHTWLLDNIPMDKRVLKQFLKSGFIHNGELFATRSGSPQGGAISSLLANMALDSMEKLLQDTYHRNSKGNIENHCRAKTKVNLVRYADDFVITAKTKEIAEEIKLLIADFLRVRGLALSEEKTAITHIDDGFDFLGWTFRKFKGKLIVKPSRKSIKAVVSKLSIIVLKYGKSLTQEELIDRLNQVIRGWTNYHKHVVASNAFSSVNNTLYLLLQRWAKHRHPNKNKWWRLNRYWHECNGKPWRFMAAGHWLVNLRTIPIVRHQNLKINMNPFLDADYFKARKVMLKETASARKGEEMPEPYERETLTYGS